MKNVNENLSKLFDVEPMEIIEAPKPSGEIVPLEQVSNATVQDDFEEARKNTKQLIKKADGALDQLLQVANQSEHPRAYEVAANLIKTLGDLNKDLLELQKRKQDLTGEKKGADKTVIDKAVFVGNTAELLKMIKEKK
jgi:phage tail tape-measure protein